jgi:IS30 family transposase
MRYTQLTREQRYQIYALLKMAHNQTEIAHCLGVHKATISRELHRNQGQRGYRPRQAHQKALSRRDHARSRIMPETWLEITAKIREDWSPEQISGWLKKHRSIQVSHEWIYQYTLADKQAGGDLHRHLRCQKKRRKRYGSYERRGNLPNRVSIDHRPAIVDQRQRIGDWEIDTIVGKGHCQAIVTLTERKSRFTLLRKVERRTADLVGNAVIDLLQPHSERLHTIMNASLKYWQLNFSLLTHSLLGNEAQMKIRMDWFDNIFRKKVLLLPLPMMNFYRSLID